MGDRAGEIHGQDKLIIGGLRLRREKLNLGARGSSNTDLFGK
jgi:hypothetical protein